MIAFAAVRALFAAANSVAASPLRGIARAAQSDLVLVDRVRSGSNVVYPNENIPITSSTNVPIGKLRAVLTKRETRVRPATV